MGKKILFLTLFFIALSACEKVDMPVEFLEINDEGVATFTVENKTGKDVASFTTELTYFSEFDRAIKIDTVGYAMEDKSKPFLKAGEETYIAQKVPEGATSALGKVLDYKVME